MGRNLLFLYFTQEKFSVIIWMDVIEWQVVLLTLIL